MKDLGVRVEFFFTMTVAWGFIQGLRLSDLSVT